MRDDDRRYHRQGWVYIVHLEAPYPNGRHPQHYIGWTVDPEHRMAMHASGRGAKFLAAAAACGIRFWISAMVPGTPTDERRAKRARRHRTHCPHCGGSLEA